MLLHPTLLFLSSYPSSPPPKSQSQTQSPLQLSQVKEEKMEDVFQRQTCVVSEETWSLGLVGDDMFVNEFLDFGGIPEVDSVEQPTYNEVCGPHETKHADPDTKSSTSTNSSAVSFDDIHPLIPAGDILDLEWVSKIVDDSQDHVRYSSHHIPTPLIITTNNHSRSLSSSSVTSSRTPTKRPLLCLESLLFPAKPRTKRTRTPSHAWTPHHPLLHSRRGRGRPPKKAEKKRKSPESDSGLGNPNPNGRRCSHCGVQKTPQWRAGPMGAKTLCNACGVRYKSGRLLPEYRPAISPTFLDHVHSNSHRKVLEMRRKKESLHRLESESLLTEPVRFT